MGPEFDYEIRKYRVWEIEHPNIKKSTVYVVADVVVCVLYVVMFAVHLCIVMRLLFVFAYVKKHGNKQ